MRYINPRFTYFTLQGVCEVPVSHQVDMQDIMIAVWWREPVDKEWHHQLFQSHLWCSFCHTCSAWCSSHCPDAEACDSQDIWRVFPWDLYTIPVYELSFTSNVCETVYRSVATGVYRYLYSPKISPSKLFMGQKWRENGYSTVLYPKNFYTPKTNFWLRPWPFNADVGLFLFVRCRYVCKKSRFR